MSILPVTLRIAIVAASVALIGCGSVPALPETFDVATSATQRSDAQKGTGPAGLANATWSLARVADPNEPEQEDAPPGPYGGILSGQGLARPPVGDRIFLIRFGQNGEMVAAEENRFFLAEFYGTDVPIGEEWSPTTLPGVVFQSASYGVQEGDHFGIAVVVHVRFANFYLGRAVLYSWGDIAADRIDGQFGYLLDFTEGLVSFLGTAADQYPVEGERVDSASAE